MLNWRTICGSNDPRHLVKGTEIEVCYPAGYHNRFALYSVRTVSREGDHTVHDMRYRVRDAGTVSDAQVREGKRPDIVCEVDRLDDALAYCREAAA